MTLVLIIISVACTLAAGYHLVVPFFADRRSQLRFEMLDEDLRRVEELVARKATLVQELRDIKLDRETGKITDEDYDTLRRRYERQAVQVMRELDELHGGRGWEETIDQELARRLNAMAARREATAEDKPAAEALIDCHACGKEMEADARFCSQCGATLGDEDAEQDDDTEQTSDAPMASATISKTGSEVAT